jgi:hypothetical protein
VALGRTNVPKECTTSIIRETIGKLGTTLAVTSCLPDDGDDMRLQNVGYNEPHSVTSQKMVFFFILILNLLFYNGNKLWMPIRL